MLDFNTWLYQHKDTIFRYWMRKPNPTPNGDYTDVLISEEAHFGRIIDAVEQPDGDVLLAFDDCGDSDGYYEYHRLSEIDLAIADTDQEVTNDEG